MIVRRPSGFIKPCLPSRALREVLINALFSESLCAGSICRGRNALQACPTPLIKNTGF